MQNINKKDIIRKKFLKIREKELIENQSKIYQQVENFITNFYCLNPNKKDQYIAIYWPLKGEVDLRGLKDSFNGPFALPCCNNKGQLEYREWTNSGLFKDSCGIPSSTREKLIQPQEMGIIFVPALAIDKNGTRLGYGGGFYDRLMEDPIWRSIDSVVVIPEKCVVKTALPADHWDIPFENWITENGQYKISNVV